MRAPALAAAVATVLLAASGAAEGPLDVRFQPPAQMGPDLEAGGATWALLVFSDGDSGLLDAGFPAGARMTSATQTSVWTYQTDWSAPAETPGPSRDLPPLDAQVSVGGAGSLFLQADSISLAVGQAAAEAVPGKCAVDLFTRAERAGREARFDLACPARGDVAVVARGSLAVHVEASGLRAAEWHGVGVRCDQAAAGSCPTGGERSGEAVGPGAEVRTRRFSYERLESTEGSLDGNVSAVRLVVGGPALDLAVQGHVRLPLAQAGPGCACPGIDGRTLRSDGAVELSQLRSSDGGLLQARVGGSLSSAHLDEEAVDPAVLLGLGAAAVAGGAVAVAFAAARLVPALFTRLTPDSALTSPLRRLLLDAVRANPGIHERALARTLGRSPSTVRHHVAMLAAQGLVERRRHGRRRLLFDRRPDAPRGVGAAVLEPDLLRLDAWRREHPGATPAATVRHAVEAWGWSRSTAYHRLARLDASLLVRS